MSIAMVMVMEKCNYDDNWTGRKNDNNNNNNNTKTKSRVTNVLTDWQREL